MKHKLNNGERIACLSLYSELSQKPFMLVGKLLNLPPSSLILTFFSERITPGWT